MNVRYLVELTEAEREPVRVNKNETQEARVQ